jgi:hypothetical protein
LIPDPEHDPDGFIAGACVAFAQALAAIRAEADREGRILVGAERGRIVWRLPGGATVSARPARDD